MKIARVPVESSHLKAVGFDEEAKVMEIEFWNGRVYRYFDVDEEVYDCFINSPSLGAFFYQHIRGWYEYQGITSED